MAVLNHAGVCVSHTTAWKYLRKLTDEAMYLNRIQDGHWIWAYDNLNIYQRVRHERYGIITLSTSDFTAMIITRGTCGALKLTQPAWRLW